MTNESSSGFKLDASVPGTLGVSGVLSFDTAAAALRDMSAVVAQGRVEHLDLSGVKRSDSAGLSCVVALMAESAQARRPLQVMNIPEGLRALAQVCEVDQYIG